MNTLEISEKVQNDPALKQSFLGVFPVDKAPGIRTLPSALILNLDTSNLSGSHWVALFFTKHGKCEYFDSYGRKPYGRILNYIAANTLAYTYNNACVQDLWTVSCGQMCLYFLIWRCRGISFKEIIQSMLHDDFIKGFIDSL